MIFGAVPVGEAEGHVLAHGHRVEGGRIAKGTVLGADEVEALRRAGLDEVVVARLEEGDVGENEAAEALARSAAGPGLRLRQPFTGRCNLVAEVDGVAVIDASAVAAANRVDESLTLATVAPWSPVREGGLVATAKVITLAVPGGLVTQAAALLSGAGPAIRVAPYARVRAALLLTELPGTRVSLLRKAEEVTRRRLEALGSTLATTRRCAHRADEVGAALAGLAEAGHDLLLVMGASAVVDRADVVPRGVEEAGGRVTRLGIPVDPGNLLLLADLADIPVLGIPGCARSPRRNGFDLVLERVLAGVPPGPAETAAMSLGGLLTEIPSRTQPREGGAVGTAAFGDPDVPDAEEADGGTAAMEEIGAVVLAAGRSTRMGERDKLLETVGGTPLVTRAVDAVAEAGVGRVVVVAGPDGDRVAAALADRGVEVVVNPHPERGMASSLARGLEAMGGGEPEGPAGVVVVLGDMPFVRPATVRALVRALDPAAGRSICVPVHGHKRGNPVLWAGRLLPELARVEGDVGGRALLGRYPEEVHEVEVDDPGVLMDVDTPEALEAAERTLETGPDRPPGPLSPGR